MDQTRPLKQTIGIPYYSNLQCDTFGMDSFEHCLDKKHYKSYKNINYSFDELGYRINIPYQRDAILAIGDSFTLGLGVNVEDTWPAQLSKILNYPVLNFSLNGASNDWIARRSTELLNFFNPKLIVVHYTFSHRRERPNPSWHDDERTECEPIYTDEENLVNWQKNFDKISTLSVPVIHSFITDWHEIPIDYAALGKNIIPPEPICDLARDGFHYGPATHQKIAEKITNLLEFV
jgi:hypothetical protein